jgi:class 3 adenylate cyclase/tetratricopeptide (TPR) repeat protein
LPARPDVADERRAPPNTIRPMKRCPACGEENADRARFCQNCATPLGEADDRAAEVRKVVTVVFSDVTGSTALGERLDPEALRHVMRRYFDEMAAVIERHEGTVEKFIGDAVMAVFGIPRLHEDDALRAVRAASDMQSRLTELNKELERDHGVGLAVRIGVNTGEVVTGDPVAGQRLVTGDAVNVAARLEQTAEPGDALLGDTTYRLVKDAVDVESIEPLELKGKSDAVAAYRLLSVRPDTAGHRRRLDSPMVGRTKELELLEHALERAVAERTSHLFTLLGSAGVGKSRLVAEFFSGPASDATVLRGRCLSYGEGITFFPLAEVVEQVARVDHADDIEAARAKVSAMLSDAEDKDRIESLVSGLLSWGEPVVTDDAFWAVRKVFEHAARERPLVVVFDDIHWAEPTFLDLIEHLADWTRDAALLLLCVARPELLELRPGWGGGKLNATSILLEPLGGADASMLVDNLLGRTEIPSAARARILEAADGNPLFVEEMLGMLIDDDLLRLEDGAWRAVDNLADVTVPPTIQLLLGARLDRLDAEERTVIGCGAVQGNVFHTGAVATLAPEAVRPRVRTRLHALARKELIRPDRAEFSGEDAFRFRHLLIRDAAYRAMPKEQRAELHERFAAWLARVAGDRTAEFEEILAYHLEQAYRLRSELRPPDERTRRLRVAAAERLFASATRAHAREDYRTARPLLVACADLADGRVRAEALVMLAEAESQLNDFPASGTAARKAMEEADHLGDRVFALRAEQFLVESLGQTDPAHTIARTRDEIVRIRKELERLGDASVLAGALIVEARHEFFAGRCDRARQICEDVLTRDIALRPFDRREAALQLGISAYYGTTPVDEALAVNERIEALLPEGLLSAAHLSTGRLGCLALAGREEDVLAELERGDRLWAEIGNPGAEVAWYNTRGDAMFTLGRLEEAERYYRGAVEILDSLGESGFNSTATAALAETLGRLHRFEEAEAAVERARALGAEDDFATEVTWRRALALVLSSRGGHDEALRLVDEAISIVETTDYLVMHAESYAVRGMVLRNAGRVAEAMAAFEGALEMFERKGAALLARRAREDIASLEGR